MTHPTDLSNYLDLVKPEEIRFTPLLLPHHHSSKLLPKDLSVATATYNITSVFPAIISNDDIVTVVFNTTQPGDNDWIGAYSPADVDITTVSPVKYGYCKDAQEDYLSTGSGVMTFNMTNLRSDIKFYYFMGSTATPTAVASSDTTVTFFDLNQPLRNRVMPTGDANIFQLMWSSYNSTSPTLLWGTVSGAYSNTVSAETITISQSQMCGAPANSTGWRSLGLIHKANITGILDLSLSNQKIYYKFGDQDTNDFSVEVVFQTPPAAGTQPPTRPTQVILMADLGVGSTDTSYDTMVWNEGCAPAVNTTMSITQHLIDSEIDAVFLSGDISYANGYMSTWDFFLDMLSPVSGGALFLNTVGNHESDWPGTSTNPGYGHSSGGECGVVSTTMLPQPYPAITNKPYWSYDIGLIHFVGMSTEHNFTIGSEQYYWIKNDLKQVNRTATPWIIFSGHRPMYVDSTQCCASYDDDDCAVCKPGTDVYVMQELQANIEPLLYKYQVNLAFAGHFHQLQRQSAVYQNKLVKASTLSYDAQGNEIAYYTNPNATVWMLLGSAGNGPNYADKNYSWSEKYWNNVFGYAMVSAVNSTYLTWQLYNSANSQVIDRVVITQNFQPWDQSVINSNDDNSSSDNGLSSTDEALIIFFTISFFLVAAGAVVKYFVLPKLATGQSSGTKEFSIYDGLRVNELPLSSV